MRVLMMLVLLMISAPAAAEWVKYWESKEETLYFDRATLRVDGGYREVWSLTDLKPWSLSNLKGYRSDGVKSMRSLDRFDCDVERHRSLTFSAHSEPMAGGKTLVSQRFEHWAFIRPDVPIAKLRKIVCAVR